MLSNLLHKNKAANPIAARCASDDITRARLRFKPYYHTFEKEDGAHIWLQGKEMINLCSNDYVGLTNHPKVIEAGQKALAKWGSSPTGARLANGSRAYHAQFEEKLAAFLGKEAVHTSAAGYLSCMSSVAGFAQRGDLIFVDKNVHSCLWSGIHVAHGTKTERFAHNNPADLAEAISLEKPEVPKMVVFEGVYSMEGHIAPVPEIVAIAKEHKAFTVLDDAHGVGVLGNQGRGTADHFGCTNDIDIICGSLSKSLSSLGGFIAGSKSLIEYLRTHAKQSIFSAALTPAQCATAEAALELLQTEPEHLARLHENTRIYKQHLAHLGLDTWQSETPAVPVVIGTKERAYRFWQLLMERGIFTLMSVAPAVPPGKDLIRTAISARHTAEDLERIAEAFAYAAKKF